MGEAIRPQLPALQEFKNHLLMNGFNHSDTTITVNSESCFLMREGWNRLSAAPFAAIALIFETVKQALRAVLMCITGLLTLDSQRLKVAFEDVLALPVQLVAVPFIVVIVIFHPKTGLESLVELDKAIGREEIKLSSQDKYFPSIATSTLFTHLFAPLTLTIDAVEKLALMPLSPTRLPERGRALEERFNYEESDINEPVLNLDAVKALGTTLMNCGFKMNDRDLEVDEDRNCLVRHLWSRIIAIPAGILSLIFKVVQQAIRGVLMCASGVLTLDWDRITFGGRDFVSIVVQTVAVPVLSVVAFIWPKMALLMIDATIRKGEDSKGFVEPSAVNLAGQSSSDKNSIAQGACTLMTAAMAPVVTPINSLEELLLNLLSLNWKSYPHTWEAFRYST